MTGACCIRGPLPSAAVAALWLRQSGIPACRLVCHFATGTDHADLVPIRFDKLSETMRRAVEPLIVKSWPGYLVETDLGLVKADGEIALLDLVQAMAELDEQGVKVTGPSWTDRWTTGVEVPALDTCIRPARLLTAPWLAGLKLPVLYSPDPEADYYLQYLPVSPDSVFVRACSSTPESEHRLDATQAMEQLEAVLINASARFCDYSR